MAVIDLDTKIRVVQDYYQGGTFWDNVDISGLSPDQINAMYDRVATQQYYTIDRSFSGDVLGRGYNNPFEMPVVPGTDFDSNIQGGAYSGGNTFTGNVPANLEINPQTGLPVRQYGGAQSVATGTVIPTIADRVSLAVMGINIGAKLGKAIDSAFYNLAPEAWKDALWALNPETWSTLCGQSAVGDFFLRTLFGVTGQGQMTGYISEDVLAYYYQMMRDNGFWATGDTTVIPPEYSGSYQQIYGGVKLINFVPVVEMKAGSYNFSGSLGNGEYVVITELTDYISFDVISKNPITAYWYYLSKSDGHIVSTSTKNSTLYYTLINNTPAYLSHLANLTKTAITDECRLELIPNSSWVVSTYTGTTINDRNLLTTVYDGTISTVPAKPGVSDLTGATQYPPTNVTGTTTADVLRELQQQYPDLFSDAITETTMQDDGTTTETTYVPIPWVTPSIEGDQPITGDGSQDDTDITPEIGEQIMPTSETSTPTDTPPTGEGSTPEVVPPTGSASSLWAVYNPSQGELNSFGAWLWSSSFVEQIKKLFADPMQAIIGVHKVFVNPPTSGSVTIKCGYLDSGVSAAVVSNQYTTLDCGSANVREYFGNVFDYDPHTKISLFLPFIGIVPLNVADVMRGSVSVKYTVDVITGACLAEVSVSRDNAGGILYTYGGSCIVSYPVSSGSYAGVISAAISTAIGVGLGLASGGASLPISLGMVARGALNAKTQVQHSGQFSGAAGVMGGKKPYLIVSRPQTRVAANVEDYAGIPSNSTIRIGDCVGFTKLSNVHLIVSNAYDNEIAEIETALKEGVII